MAKKSGGEKLPLPSFFVEEDGKFVLHTLASTSPFLFRVRTQLAGSCVFE